MTTPCPRCGADLVYGCCQGHGSVDVAALTRQRARLLAAARAVLDPTVSHADAWRMVRGAMEEVDNPKGKVVP